MPKPPPLRFRSDNIKRVVGYDLTARLVTAVAGLRSKTAPWLERDPDEVEAWWRSVLADPRARRTTAETIPERHPDASLRLDRFKALTLTVRCRNCKVFAVFTLDDLRSKFAPDQNVMRLPAYLLPCKSKRDRRDGVCSLRAEPGGYTEHLRTVAQAAREVS